MKKPITVHTSMRTSLLRSMLVNIFRLVLVWLCCVSVLITCSPQPVSHAAAGGRLK